jgi:alpha-1,2-mannosyltransferase
MEASSPLPNATGRYTSLVMRIGALCTLAALVFYALLFVDANDTLDLRIYLDSAQRLRDGVSLYEVRYSFPDRATDFDLQYLYPPALAALLAMVSFIPRPTLIVLWQLGLVASIVTSAVMLSRMFRVFPSKTRKEPSSFALFMALALWPPTLDGILWGQVNAYILALLVCAAYCAARGRDTASGMAVGLAAALKGTPILLAIPLVIHGRWRALVAAAGAIITAHLPLAMFPKGLQSLPEFLITTREIASGHVVNDPFYDYSIRRVASLCVDAPALIFSCFTLIIICVYLALTVRQTRRVKSEKTSGDAQCSVQMLSAIPIMMLASPLVWFHHLIWLFPVLATICSLGSPSRIRYSAVGLYLLLAPLLYVHVFVRNFTSLSDIAVKTLPVCVICASYFLINAGMQCSTVAQSRLRRSKAAPQQ